MLVDTLLTWNRRVMFGSLEDENSTSSSMEDMFVGPENAKPPQIFTSTREMPYSHASRNDYNCTPMHCKVLDSYVYMMNVKLLDVIKLLLSWCVGS